MRTFLIALIPVCAALGGCVSDGSQMVADASVRTTSAAGSSEMVYVRADGKRLSSNPALAQQLEIDRTICRGEAEKIDLVARDEIDAPKKNLAVSLINAGIKESKIHDVMKGCMAQHGYVYMSVAEAEARADALAAGAPAKKKRKRA